MRTAIAKWGNSLALRISRGVAEDAQLAEGDTVDVRVEGDELIITRVKPRYSLDELMAQYHPEHRRGETDWGSDEGGEAW